MNNNKNIIIIIFLLLLYSCKQYEVKEEVKDACPKNNDEFIQNFNLNNFDIIKNKVKLAGEYYAASNERRIDFFYPYIKDLRGGYIGVGTDQNFTFTAWAKSDYAYLMDFDWVALYVNRLHILFFKHSESFNEFKNFWSPKNYKQSIKLIEQEIQDKEEKSKHKGIYTKVLNIVTERFNDFDYMTKNFNFQSFHNNEEDFLYIKKMINENRIYPVLGDINATVTFQEINQASKRLCIPIRILYLSNAEEYYRYPENFRNNIRNMYIDENSLIIRTASTGAKTFGYPKGEKYMDVPFHYNMQKIANLIEWFSIEKLWIFNMLQHRRDIETGFSILEKTPIEVGLIKPDPQIQTSEKK